MEPPCCLPLGAHRISPIVLANGTGIVKKSRLHADNVIGLAMRTIRVASLWCPVLMGCVQEATADYGGCGNLPSHDAPAAQRSVPVSSRRTNRFLTLLCGCSYNIRPPHLCLPADGPESQSHIDYRGNLICLFEAQTSIDS
ncbi:hypothetical protein CGRA01v4_10480 [Colletotrichum graminicola]|nr:hypothetical protein CGRA01v4_10480 [Colletotrichum graminicola]